MVLYFLDQKIMPKLSLWKNAKTKDYYYQDRQIREAISVGGTSMLVHKYLGPAAVEDGSDPAKPDLKKKDEINELDIQDLLFMENRDRIYDTTIYELDGTYNVNDQDFDLSQFGLFLNADTLFITFHTNEMVSRLGRKLMAGDVIELPHLNDDLLLDANAKSINKFYAVQDASRSAEGFGPTWWPHLWRVKVSPINDAQEYRSILGDPSDENSLKNALSTYQREIEISTAILESAKVITPSAGYANPDINEISTVPVIKGFDGGGESNIAVNTTEERFQTTGDYTGVPNGISFPLNASPEDLFVRMDFTPARLFVYRGTRWHRILDNVLSKKDIKMVTGNAGSFIDNTANTVVPGGADGSVVTEQKQSLSQIFTKNKRLEADE